MNRIARASYYDLVDRQEADAIPPPGLVTINLSFPPSVNRIWRSRTGHNGKPQFYLSPRYASWKRDNDNRVMAMRPRPRVKGRFSATITLSDKKRRANSDADNRVKAILDFLQRAEIIENDSLADAVTVRWGYAPDGVRVVLMPSGALR